MQTIDDVVEKLYKFTQDTIADYDPLGYFAALYYQVTVKVRDDIRLRRFENPDRMELLGAIFAKRYFDAMSSYLSKQTPSKSWSAAFDVVDDYWLNVFQHLMTGMNAHINLDLGIAAAQVGGDEIEDLKADFFKINEILASMVHKVENDYAEIWPTLRFILKFAGRADNFLIDFSMQHARDGAWAFAVELAKTPEERREALIQLRDQKVAQKSKLITNPGFLPSFIFKIMRIGETGNVPSKIKCLLD
ncbi:DUF5995 family protein [Reichenbachiella agarivorans]|uniref:DUF5995 family protein n=1 Tax=Reichenbachiella agarivorans TaxID=2979464 RepID=A0ABY6CR73_9BACT|nr:DUF5995 family protein [Reichenbachiella agarivorans]UXP33009.1 DUF5995 family protein [Reichenbachiella agarivorans]